MYQVLVSLNVSDQDKYTAYRQGMKPILHKLGGGFIYDFHVSETLKSPENKSYNRVFIISFPSEEISKEFFGNSEYQKIKEELFVPAVEYTNIIASF